MLNILMRRKFTMIEYLQTKLILNSVAELGYALAKVWPGNAQIL